MRCPSPATPWYSSFSTRRRRTAVRLIPSDLTLGARVDRQHREKVPAVDGAPPGQVVERNLLAREPRGLERDSSRARQSASFPLGHLTLKELVIATRVPLQYAGAAADNGPARWARWVYRGQRGQLPPDS